MSNVENLPAFEEAAAEPEILWIPVQKAAGMIWAGNMKRHDLGGIMLSLQKYGLQELPLFDVTLGAIKAGNGRVEALAAMEKDGHDMPRGLLKSKDDGSWFMPVLGGVDAATEAEAKAYAVDSNNLTMAGGDFADYDYMKMWDESAYKGLLRDLAEHEVFTVTNDETTLADLLKDYRDLEIDFGGRDGSSTQHTGDAGKEPKEDEEDDAPPPEVSGIRQVQLFLSAAEHSAFMRAVEAFKEEYGLTSITDVVNRVMLDAYEELQEEPSDDEGMMV